MSLQSTRPVTRVAALAAGADLVAVLVFALLGRSSHGETLKVIEVLGTAAPFLLGLGVGWLVGRVWRDPVRLSSGAAAWAGAAVVGLAVRAAFTHRLPVSFALIATATLAVVLFGWRVCALLVTRARARNA